jgi:molybdenum cofactor cytidylyltransferase
MAGRQVIAMILAAGASRRMGRPKLLMRYGDGTIIEAVLDAVLQSSVDGLVIVVNRQIKSFLDGDLPDRCYLALNDSPASEMLTSVRIGLQKARQAFDLGPDDGIMVLPGDQPQVTGGTITTLAETYRLPRRAPEMLIATYRRRRGHPAIFSHRLLEEIEDWPDDLGLNELAVRHPDSVRELPITTGPLPIDVNTPEDYQRLPQG